MIKTIKIYIRYEQLKNLNRADKIVAEEFGVTPSRVRSAVNECKNDPRALLELIKWKTNNALTFPGSHDRMRDIVDTSRKVIGDHRDKHSSGYAIYLSDIHLPYQYDSALELVVQIVEDLQPVWISALNDGLDYAGLSDFNDLRPLREQQFDADLDISAGAYVNWIETLNLVSPDSKHIAIVGNHEARLGRLNERDGRDYVAVNLMEKFYDAGILFDGGIATQNFFPVTENLVWLHGVSAAKSQRTVAQRTVEAAKQVLGTRYDVDCVVGHTHRPNVTHYSMATVYNSGCLCITDPFYVTHKQGWKHGIVISHFDGNDHETDLVMFNEKNNKLTARYGGKVYEVSTFD